MTNSTRHRASLSSTSIPVPPESHTSHHVNQQPHAQNLLSVNSLFSDRRNSQPQLSSSAPSSNSFLSGPINSSSSSQRNSNDTSSNIFGGKRESTSGPNSPMMTIEFDGGTHIIIRPNRVIRGKNFFSKKNHAFNF